MATFNTSAKGRMRTQNISGHAAYKMDSKTDLVSMALTTMLNEKKFYGDNTDRLISTAEDLCKSGDGEFVAKLAVWARTVGNLRSVSHALMAVVGRNCSGEKFVRPAMRTIASMRGDDGTETIAAYLSLYGKPINHAVLRGIRDALEASSPYSVAKYQSRGKSVKLRDVLRMTHPAPSRQDTSEAMGKAVSGELGVPKSWETEISARGNSADVWNELIAEDRVPYFASLRNLRSMIATGADIGPVLDKIANPDAVRKSRLLPFRFYTAYKELSLANMLTTRVARAIDDAMRASLDNVPALDGRTCVMIDTSGSMGWQLSKKSVATPRDIAAVLGAMATYISDDALVIGFHTFAQRIPMTGTSVIADCNLVPCSGGWTNMESAFNMLHDSGFDADRVIVLSDNEVNLHGRMGRNQPMQQALARYEKKVGHDVWCHAIDLQGYGTQQFMGPRVNYIAGWSEQVLSFVSLAERGFGSVVSEIESVVL